MPRVRWLHTGTRWLPLQPRGKFCKMGLLLTGRRARKENGRRAPLVDWAAAAGEVAAVTGKALYG